MRVPPAPCVNMRPGEARLVCWGDGYLWQVMGFFKESWVMVRMALESFPGSCWLCVEVCICSEGGLPFDAAFAVRLPVPDGLAAGAEVFEFVSLVGAVDFEADLVTRLCDSGASFAAAALRFLGGMSRARKQVYAWDHVEQSRVPMLSSSSSRHVEVACRVSNNVFLCCSVERNAVPRTAASMTPLRVC